jgi:DNA polymerase
MAAELQVEKLKKKFDELQALYGDKNLDAIYGAGEIRNPKICLVFMNPTGKNVSANKNWKGLKAPWLGTKNVWRFLSKIDLFDKALLLEIEQKKPKEWDYDFAEKVYKEIKRNSVYITNLCKATQKDAKPVSNKVFKKYLDLFKEEMLIVKPKIIIAFGNRVASLLLNKNVSLSRYRGKYEEVKINGEFFKVFPVYYPLGQGMKNIKIAESDLKKILQKYV